MKYFQMKLLATAMLLALSCSYSFGQDTNFKKQNGGSNKGAEQSEDVKSLIMHHLKSFQENDLAALMSDFTPESVLITQDATYVGLDEIRTYFANLMGYFPKESSSVELDKLETKDNLGYIIWHAKTPSLEVIFATDTFIEKKGKFYRQTFAGQIKFIK